MAYKKNSYGGGKSSMGHEKKPMKCNPFEAQKSDMGKVQKLSMTNRGYPKQAWEYKY